MDSFTSFFDYSRSRFNFVTLKNFHRISPVVQNHLKQVYLTLCFAVAAAAVGGYVHVLFNIGGFLTAIACVGFSIWLLETPPFEEQKRLTLLMASAMFQGASVGFLIDFAIQIDPSAIFCSFVAFALAFWYFSGAALVAMRREHLYLGGLVSFGISILFLLHFASFIFGGSLPILKFELYFGLLVFVVYIIINTQEIVEKAHSGDLDYVLHALTLLVFVVYIIIDTQEIVEKAHSGKLVAIFVRILVIMLMDLNERIEKKKKKKTKD